MEKEPWSKQEKYRNHSKIKIESDNQSLHFTGMYKYVDTGKKNAKDESIVKRKRIFRRCTKLKRYLSKEQHEEIEYAFKLFDKDRSGSIDVGELRDAMKALGVFLKKEDVR